VLSQGWRARCLPLPRAASFPDTLSIPHSVDGLIMVLMGGIHALAGPVLGATVFVLLEDWISRFDYWRFIFGVIILFVVLVAPDGLAGGLQRMLGRAIRAWPSTEGDHPMSLLQVRDLSKSFGGLQAVADVSFDLDQGEFLALIGPNGAGKTTCFNMLNGYLKADTGFGRLKGRELLGLPPRRIWRMGVGEPFRSPPRFCP
jgi:branched-chain amino acid transport system permease protein